MSQENRIKAMAKENGAVLVGITSTDRLSDAPPSGNPTYLLHSTRSIVSFAIPIDRTVIRDYLGKKNWLALGAELKRIDQALYRVADRLAEDFSKQGHEARVVDLNQVYRPEPGGTSAHTRVAYVPDFSHRYAAVASGLGWLGWSGNLLTERFGGAVLLGSVLTSAELKPDPMMTSHEDRCEKCRVCATVCPSGYFSSQESMSVTIGGTDWTYAKRGIPMRCAIGCNGYHGLLGSGKWSTWSPYRLSKGMPADDAELNDLSRRVRAADPEKRRYADYGQREYCSDPNLTYSDTCANCQMVCWAEREERLENKRLLSQSGVVVLSSEGKRFAVDPDEAAVIDTPFELQVAVPKRELPAIEKREIFFDREQDDYVYPLDAEALSSFMDQSSGG